MATELNKGKELEIVRLPHYVRGKFYVFSAKWNDDVVGKLREGCIETLLSAGVKAENIVWREVPGTVELIYGAASVIEHFEPAAVIILGCVIRGDTPHFDYVCHIASEGTALLNSRGKAPVIFGVLTVENREQALARAGGELGNKGSEAAVAAIEMASLLLE
ncbi:MAG: 6,7-dimethyl-8-ribityllumazine synthase [Muribaculaceae bacterium]|nr:6,7-dimethyl-8-ribityllumazine synthase [Muribaculaceae bacterium]